MSTNPNDHVPPYTFTLEMWETACNEIYAERARMVQKRVLLETTPTDNPFEHDDELRHVEGRISGLTYAFNLLYAGQR